MQRHFTTAGMLARASGFAIAACIAGIAGGALDGLLLAALVAAAGMHIGGALDAGA